MWIKCCHIILLRTNGFWCFIRWWWNGNGRNQTKSFVWSLNRRRKSFSVSSLFAPRLHTKSPSVHQWERLCPNGQITTTFILLILSRDSSLCLHSSTNLSNSFSHIKIGIVVKTCHNNRIFSFSGSIYIYNEAAPQYPQDQNFMFPVGFSSAPSATLISSCNFTACFFYSTFR